MTNGTAAEAYDRTATHWLDGPDRVYVKYAEAMVTLAPPEWAGALVADLAAGTGSVAQALSGIGARPIAVDGAPTMLALARRRLRAMPAAAGDVLALPLRLGCVDGATVGFCINHLREPDRLLAEALRVVRPGGTVLMSTFARGDEHPAKDVVNAVAAAYGWRPSPWYVTLHDAAQLTDTPELLTACAERAGFVDVQVTELEVHTGLVTAEDLVGWRLGMPEMAALLTALPPEHGSRLRERSVAELGADPPPLVRRILVLRALTPAHSRGSTVL